MRHVITVAGVLLLGACGTVASTRLDIAPATFTAFEVKDERPAGERKSSVLKESYGELTYLGDDAITPSAPQLLKAWLGQKLGERLSGKKVVLKKFSVQVLDPSVTIDGVRFNNAMASTPGAGPISGMLARVFIAAIERTKSDKTVGVNITGSIDNVEFSGHGGGTFMGRVSEENINSVITEALDKAVADIQRLIKKEPPLPSSPEMPTTEASGG